MYAPRRRSWLGERIKRMTGIAVLLFAAFVLFAGWAIWSESGEEATSLKGMRAVTAATLATAHPGDRVVVEGTTIVRKGAPVAPVSKTLVSWYTVRRTHHWQEISKYCSRNGICHDYWANRHEDAPTNMSAPLKVRLAGSSKVIDVTIPDEPYAVSRHRMNDTRKVDMHRPATKTHRGDYIEEREYIIAQGVPVTIAGKVTGSGSDRTIAKVQPASLVYQVERGAMINTLHGDERVGIIIMIISVLITAGGIWILVSDNRRRRRDREAELAAAAQAAAEYAAASERARAASRGF